MIVNRENLLAVSISWHTVFNDRVKQAELPYRDVALVVPSNSRSEMHRWLNSVPRMREWVGDRVIDKLSAEGTEIQNKDYANGVTVERDDIEDDKTGMVAQKVRRCADAWPWLLNELVFSQLENAFTSVRAWDGQWLVDTDHVAATGGTAQSNHLGAVALTDDNLDAALAKLIGLKLDNGEAAVVKPKFLVTGTDATTWTAARKILGKPTLDDGTENLNEGLLQHVWSPRITDDKWFVMADPSDIPAIILQIRRDVAFRAPVTSFDDFIAFVRKDLYFGADGTAGVGPGMWQGLVGSPGA